MNKNELISEIYEFEKELAQNYDKKLSTRDKFSPYFINKGVLVRQVFDGKENIEINARDLKTTEELITFYENFFKSVDNAYENTYKSLKDNCQNSNSKYFNKLSCFLAGGYDSFERIYNNHNSGQTDSLSFIFKKRFQNDFIYEVDIKGKTLSKWYKFEYNKYFITFMGGLIGFIVTGFFYFLFDNLIGTLVSGSIFSFIVAFDIIKAQYTLRTHHITKIEEEFFSKIHDLSSQELLKYIKLCKYENYFNDYFKGDVLYEELKRRYNISTTNSENEIVKG